MHKIHIVDPNARCMKCGLQITKKRKYIESLEKCDPKLSKDVCSVCATLVKREIMAEIRPDGFPD